MTKCPIGGRGARSQFRLSLSGGFFKGLYPFRGDIMDVEQASQTAGLSASDFVSPSKGTRTRTVREYEQTISELKKENFDLKLRVYLLEETMNKNRGISSPSTSNNDDNAVQVMVQLQLETRNVLIHKEKLLQDAVEQNGKYVADIKEWEEKSTQLQTLLSELPSQDECVQLLHEREDLLKRNEALERSLAEKVEELNEANQKLEIVSECNCVLEEKLKKRNLVIQSYVYKSYQEQETLPDALRSMVVGAVQAAKQQDRDVLTKAVNSICASLNQIMCSPMSMKRTCKEKLRSSLTKCLKEEYREKPQFVLSSQSEAAANITNVHSERINQSSDLGSFVLRRGEITTEISENFSKKDEVNLMNFSSVPLIVPEETRISDPTQPDSFSSSGVINIENIFSPLTSPILSPQYKNVSTSNLCQKFKASSTSMSIYDDKNTCNILLYDAKDECVSVSLPQYKNAVAYQSVDTFKSSLHKNKDASTVVSPEHSKKAFTSVLSPHFNNVSTFVSMPDSKDVSASVSCTNIYASTSVSRCNNKDVSTSVSFGNIDAPTSVSYEGIDESISVTRHDNKDISAPVSLHERENASRLASFLKFKDVSVSTLNIDDLQRLIMENEQLRQIMEDKLATIQSLTVSKEKKFQNVQTEEIQSASSKVSLCSNACSQTHMDDVAEKSGIVDTVVEESQAILNEDYLTELHERLAFSCSVNVELMHHLHNLEQFMEDLLQHKLENSSGCSTYLASVSKCLKLSNVLSDHLSICEGSKLFEEHKSLMCRTGSLSDEKSVPQLDFSELNLPDIPIASDPRYFQPSVVVTHCHPNYLSSDSDIWSEPDRDISMQRIGIVLQQSPISTKSPRKFRSKEKKISGRNTTDHDNTSSSEMWFKHSHKQNGSARRRLFDKENRDLTLEKIYFIVAEKLEILKSLLSSLENMKNEEVWVELWTKMNFLLTSLNETVQKFQMAKEGSYPSMCGKCVLLELLITLKMSLGDFNIQEMSLGWKKKIIHQFQTEVHQLMEVCGEPFTQLLSAQVNKFSKSTQSEPISNSKQKRIDELEEVVIDLNCKNEILNKKFEKVQNLLGHERNMMESVKTENLLMFNKMNHLKEEIVELNGKNNSLVGNLDEVHNLFMQERNVLEVVKSDNLLLSNEIKQLKEEITNLKQKHGTLCLQNSELDKKLFCLSKENSELNEILKVLELQKNESDDVLNQLSTELQKNKSELTNMSMKCLELEKELGHHIKIKEEFAEKLKIVESSSSIEKQKFLNEIENLNIERNNCMQKSESVQCKMLAFEKEISVLNDNLNTKDDKLSSLLKTIETLQYNKEALTATCIALQSDLETAKEQNLNLQQKCNSCEEEISKKLTACQDYHQELQELELKLISEKNELLNKISFLTTERDHIFEKLKSEREHSEKLLAEKTEVDLKFAESCQKISSLKSAQEERKKLAEKLSFITSEREDILQDLMCEKECSRALMAEKMDLNQKLLENRQQNEEFERAHSNLIQKNEEIQTVLLSSDSNSAILRNDLQHMRDTVLNLESKCAAYEKELVASTGMKDYGIECLLRIRHEFVIARQKMAEMGKACEDDFVVYDETPVPDFEPTINEDNIAVLCDLLSSENKKLLKTVEMCLLRSSQLKLQKVHAGIEMASTTKDIEMQKHEINHLKTQNNYLQKMVDEKQKLLCDNEKSVTSSGLEIHSLNEKLQNSENEVEKGRLLLRMKEDEIMMLQERIFNLQTYVNSVLEEKNDFQKKMNPHLVERSVQVDFILPNNLPFQQTFVGHAIDRSCQIDHIEECVAGVDDYSMSNESLSSVKASCCEKYQSKCRSLQRKLFLLQKRVEILEEEKNDLREFRFSCMNSVEEKGFSDVERKLEQKKAFVEELKAELLKVCNSLIDKERETDDLKIKLSEYESKLKFTTISISKNENKAVDANIENLNKCKWKLIQTIFDIQGKFYEHKGIHMTFFDKFKDHVNALYSLQLLHPLSKAQSLPLLGFSYSKTHAQSSPKAKQLMGLELDIQCLENLKIFLSSFFVPSVLHEIVQTKHCLSSLHLVSHDVQTHPAQNTSFVVHVVQTDSTPKVSDFISTQHDIFSKNVKSVTKVKSVNTPKLEKPKYLEFFGNVPGTNEDILKKHSSLESFAGSLSHCLDFLENFFKECKSVCSLDHFVIEKKDKAEVMCLLLKIMKEIKTLYEKAGLLFNMNILLKSLDLLPTHILNSPDISDTESVLSEETITISRSETPLSEDLQLPYSPTLKAKETITKTQPLECITKPKVATLSSSFESVHHRSQYSSPDLGIESDPNHEYSVPEQKDNEIGCKYQRVEDRKNVIKGHLTSPEKTGQWKGGALLLSGDSLYCMGQLPHYELLKREIQESLVGIKSILSRTGDGLRHIANYTSPRKTLEYSTMRAIKDSCANVEMCLKEAYKLVGKFWIAPCPSEQEWNTLIDENQKLSEELTKLQMLMQNQESEFKKAIRKLEHAELLKANMEKKISKKLVKTKKVIRQAQLKLLETGCQNCPPVPKYPTPQQET